MHIKKGNTFSGYSKWCTFYKNRNKSTRNALVLAAHFSSTSIRECGIYLLCFSLLMSYYRNHHKLYSFFIKTAPQSCPSFYSPKQLCQTIQYWYHSNGNFDKDVLTQILINMIGGAYSPLCYIWFQKVARASLQKSYNRYISTSAFGQLLAPPRDFQSNPIPSHLLPSVRHQSQTEFFEEIS